MLPEGGILTQFQVNLSEQRQDTGQRYRPHAQPISPPLLRLLSRPRWLCKYRRFDGEPGRGRSRADDRPAACGHPAAPTRLRLERATTPSPPAGNSAATQIVAKVATNAPPVPSPHHWRAVSRDGSILLSTAGSIYLNAKAVGAHTGATRPFNGIMHELILFHSVLSPEDRALVEHSLMRYVPEPGSLLLLLVGGLAVLARRRRRCRG